MGGGEVVGPALVETLGQQGVPVRVPEGIRVPVRGTRAAEGRLRPGGGDLLDVVGVLDAEQAEVVEQTGLADGQLLRLGEFGEAQSPSPAARAMSLLMLVS